MLGCAVFLAGCAECALVGTPGPAPAWRPDLLPAAGLVYAAVGAFAWRRRPSNATGGILLLGALSWLVAGLANASVPGLAAAGTVTALLPVAVVVHLLLAFPSGRLRSWQDRCMTVIAYVTALVLHIPLYLFAPSASPGGILAVASRPGLAHDGQLVQDAVGGAGFVILAIWLIERIWRAGPARRRILVPLYAYSLAAALIMLLWPSVIEPLTGLSAAARSAIQVAVLAGVPLAFAAAMLSGRFARMAEIHDLGAWLGDAGPGRLPLAAALARALGDDSVELAFWAPAMNRYVDAQGGPVTLPVPAGDGPPQRAVAEVTLGGQPVGAISYDPMLIADPELVRDAGRVVALAIDRERLTAELLAAQAELLEQAEALRLSRARLAEAADTERRRIAQDLHDGLQARLLLLAIEAQLLGSPGLRERIDKAAAELRELVHRVMPAALIEGGLGAAARDLADRAPLPVEVDDQLDDAKVPDHVASTAYFMLAEGITNALRHAKASALAIRLHARDGMLHVAVSDDGIGGARVAGAAGLGLRGLADRVAAVGGRLLVESPPGGGTRLTAEIPCE